MSSSSSSSTTLPLSSLLASSAPQHPLPRLLTDPILPRLAAFEAAFLLSRPAAFVVRFGLASERGLVAIALTAVAAGVTRWRAQWRAMLWALGVGEALARTVRVMRRRGKGAVGEKGGDNGDEDAQRQADAEAEHVLAWWLLFAAFSLLDTLRTSPTSASPSSFFSLPSRLRTLLHALRHTYLRFLRLYVLPHLLRARYTGRQLIERYPRLNPSPLTAKLPSLALPALLQRCASPLLPSRPVFPQPRLHALSDPSPSLPLSWSYFASRTAFSPSSPVALASATSSAEKRWEVVKLLLLWTGLRRDAFGARSVLWEWVLEPLFGGSESATRETVEVRAVRRSEQEEERGEKPTSRRSSGEERRRTLPAVGQDDASSPLSSSSTSLHAPYSVPSSLPSAAFSWTPTRPSPSRSPGGSNSTTPRRALSLASAARSPSPTPSSAPFAFPTPTAAAAAPSRTLTHPLIPLTLTLPAARSPSSSSSRGRLRPASSSSSGAKTGTAARGGGGGGREKRASLLFESPPKGAQGFPSSSSSSESESESEAEEGGADELDAFRAHLQRNEVIGLEEAEELDVPQTPGEEEASEGARGWGDVRMGLERTLSEADEGEGDGGGEGEGREGAGRGRWSV
ncbi:hypothetical protein JCM8097_005525 [Rhodosporidiobolus ruineniae]